MHPKPHPNARTTVRLKAGGEYRLEDWWDRLGMGSWMDCVGNPACLQYAIRAGLKHLPTDDEVVYGKIGSYGHLMHVRELDL